jgi:hypothetical protein
MTDSVRDPLHLSSLKLKENNLNSSVRKVTGIFRIQRLSIDKRNYDAYNSFLQYFEPYDTFQSATRINCMIIFSVFIRLFERTF